MKAMNVRTTFDPAHYVVQCRKCVHRFVYNTEIAHV
jgi:hypothetical protein